MCRLAAFPPNFKREDALDILLDMEGRNEDGVGSAHVENGKFVINKWPTSLSAVLKKGVKFLGHMPFDGWTIAHMRLASHGENKIRNTHPFPVDNWAICHNGVWSDHRIARLAMSNFVKFYGETDTEVAANLINQIGVKEFAKQINYGGVFLCLNRSGTLWAIKVSGDLELMKHGEQMVLASEFPTGTKILGDAWEGWYCFDKTGKYSSNFKKDKITYYQGGGCSIVPRAKNENPIYDPVTVRSFYTYPSSSSYYPCGGRMNDDNFQGQTNHANDFRGIDNVKTGDEKTEADKMEVTTPKKHKEDDILTAAERQAATRALRLLENSEFMP